MYGSCAANKKIVRNYANQRENRFILRASVRIVYARVKDKLSFINASKPWRTNYYYRYSSLFDFSEILKTSIRVYLRDWRQKFNINVYPKFIN